MYLDAVIDLADSPRESIPVHTVSSSVTSPFQSSQSSPGKQLPLLNLKGPVGSDDEASASPKKKRKRRKKKKKSQVEGNVGGEE